MKGFSEMLVDTRGSDDIHARLFRYGPQPFKAFL